MTAFTINFEPLGRRGECQQDESLLNCAHRLGVGINSICGGKGTCHSCKMQVLSGTVSKPTSSEQKTFTLQELQSGWRLACQTFPSSDCTIAIPPDSMTTHQRIQVEGTEIKVHPEPPVQSYQLQLAAPSLSEPRADADILLGTLNQQFHLHCDKIDFHLLRVLSTQLRDWNWKCQVIIRNEEVIALLPWQSRQLGLAIDLGTTKIAGYLIDLGNGRTLVSKGVMNPQISYGEDIISRITNVVHSSGNGVSLQKLAADAINDICADLCTEVSAAAEEVIEIVVVGNTAMHHLFLGLPVKQLAVSPFIPAVSRALEVKACNLGIRSAPGAYVYLLPNVAGFVGADHVAMLLATKASLLKETTVALDIGTNTEVSLVHNGKVTATSCASGPAFEGGHIKFGMRAAAGAIEHIRIDADTIQFQTVDEAPPIGICGSGILDALSQLYLAGIINEDGKIMDNHPRVRSNERQREFVLVSEEERGGQSAITITQQDIRELQLAKAAIRSGIQALLEAQGCTDDTIQHIIVAGAFGSYIDISSAVTIGMLPALPLKSFQQAGNAAGMGAKLALISLSQRAEAEAISSRIKYVELASAPNFNQTFIQASYLGQYRLKKGRREKTD
jgi:uncharacterized 2Fe-2S/4Fe-4S cluster protein (DUF4445 family)